MWSVLGDLRPSSGSDEQFGENSEHWVLQTVACWTQPHCVSKKDESHRFVATLESHHCPSLYEAWDFRASYVLVAPQPFKVPPQLLMPQDASLVHRYSMSSSRC